MTDQEIIAKAKNALDAMKIGYDKDDISVAHLDNLSSLFDMLELNEKERQDLESKYSIHFKDKLPNGLFRYFSIDVDKYTYKLIYVLTEHNYIPIPEELQ